MSCAMEWPARSIMIIAGIFLSICLVKCEEPRCIASTFRCDNKCLPIAWKCDDSADCSDNTDEKDCPPKTCGPEEFRCADDRCIPHRWRCDGQEDCNSASDEDPEVCANVTCKKDQFACGDGGCIPRAWRCDGQADCKNGKDEQNCESLNCTGTQFTCKNKECIVQRWVCDGDADCQDHSDEENCSPKTCSPTEFKCDSNSTCIPNRWRCDGDDDCGDGSDEQGCEQSEPSACVASDFQCRGTGECIHKAWTCDGDKDCDDGSDEADCTNTCRPDQFRCNNNDCIHGKLQCNGQRECTDGSDEIGCGDANQHSCDREREFDCLGNGKECIPLANVCDGKRDCGGGEEEHAAVCRSNPCAVHNGNCSQRCIFTHTDDICFCNPGYKLGPDKKTCLDIDECATQYGICAQKCVNEVGSHRCECNVPGYKVDPARPSNCKVLSVIRPHLMFSHRHGIRLLDLHSRTVAALVKNTDSAVAMDYDYKEKLVFWTDSANEKIYRTSMVKRGNGDGPWGKDWMVVASNVSTSDGIAVDWIHKLIFWTDTGKNTIEVARFDGSMKTVLVHEDLDEPRDIVVDPINAYIYWTDWTDTHPRIEKCGMNGNNRQAIITRDLQWPNGLTIDFVLKRLYWVDAKLHLIGSSDFNGGNRRTILQSQSLLMHPFSVAVFEDRVYWSDWEHEAIKSVNKFTGNNTQILASKLPYPMDLHIGHPIKQPAGDDVCQLNNGACSHLCLPAPKISLNSPLYTCHCPINYRLDQDGLTCVSVTGPTAVPTVTVQATNGTKTSEEAEDIGRVAGIVIGVVLFVTFIVFVVVFILYRQYTRRNVKSMNFDNPVYRKTTEDHVSLDKNQYQPRLPSTLEPLNTPGTELEV